MVDRPTIIRSRIWNALASRYPRGMSAGQIQQMVINCALTASQLKDELVRMVGDGLLAEGMEPREFPREPIPIYLVNGGVR